MSAVIFSWSIVFEGTLESDFRDEERFVAGRVTSSLEDIMDSGRTCSSSLISTENKWLLWRY